MKLKNEIYCLCFFSWYRKEFDFVFYSNNLNLNMHLNGKKFQKYLKFYNVVGIEKNTFENFSYLSFVMKLKE